MLVNIPSVSDNMKEEQTWTENEIKELILFAQSLREENEELRSKIIVMDSMVKKREATLKKAQQYISQLEFALINHTPNINLN